MGVSSLLSDSLNGGNFYDSYGLLSISDTRTMTNFNKEIYVLSGESYFEYIQITVSSGYNQKLQVYLDDQLLADLSRTANSSYQNIIRFSFTINTGTPPLTYTTGQVPYNMDGGGSSSSVERVLIRSTPLFAKKHLKILGQNTGSSPNCAIQLVGGIK